MNSYWKHKLQADLFMIPVYMILSFLCKYNMWIVHEVTSILKLTSTNKQFILFIGHNADNVDVTAFLWFAAELP